jgi:hypothetical protein
MALENADGGGGDWIPADVVEELAASRTLAVFKILRILPGEKPKPTSRSEWFPVIADMLILDGKRKGTVYRSERFTKSGIVNTLRQKFDPRDAELKPKDRRKIARTEGTDLVARFGFYKDNEGVQRVCINAARADDVEEVKALFEATGDDPYGHYEAEDRKNSVSVMSGAPAPVDDDDEPPF